MPIETYFERISRIDQLIRLKATGSPSDLAYRLEISESTLYRYLSYMQLMGAPIAFSRSSNSYIYEDNGKFQVGFVLNPVKKDNYTNSFGRKN